MAASGKHPRNRTPSTPSTPSRKSDALAFPNANPNKNPNANPNANPRRNTKPPRVSKQRAIVLFEKLENLVPREQMREILESCGDPRAAHFGKLLFDASNRNKPMPELARSAGFTYMELVRVLVNHGLGEGLVRMSTHAPKVLEDTAIDAMSRIVGCPQCKGTGTVAEQIKTEEENEDGELESRVQLSERECWSCGGTGKLRKPGDPDAREMVFSALGLNQKNNPMVNINIGATGARNVEDDLGDLDKVLNITPERKVETEGER